MLGLDRGPAAGALLAGGILDDVEKRPAARRVLGVGDLAGNLDEIGLQGSLVPAIEDVADL